jgi:hypothetical protein
MDKCILIGCDLHDRSMLLKIAVGLAVPDKRSWSNDRSGRVAMIGDLKRGVAAVGANRIVFAYEASGLGFTLYDELTASGTECHVLAPTLMERSVKHSKGKTDGRVLARMVEDESIRRLAPGLFDSPRINERLGGQLSADVNQVAQAMARKFRWTIAPQGALAANRLGLSQQVPAQYAYLTDCPTRRIKVGNRVIQFHQHARPKDLRAERVLSATVVQALRHLGRRAVDQQVI